MQKKVRELAVKWKPMADIDPAYAITQVVVFSIFIYNIIEFI